MWWGGYEEMWWEGFPGQETDREERESPVDFDLLSLLSQPKV
jgi:hypothetical protein